MNCVNLLSNAIQKSVSPFLTASVVLSQQTRNTFILKRRNDPPLHKKNERPKRLKQRNFIYDLVENTDVKKKNPLDVILTTYVEGMGNRGDKISLRPLRAYNQFLLPGLAVYASPENIKKYESETTGETKAAYSSPYVPRTINILQHYLLNVVMSNEVSWTLEKWHIRSAFRKAGIFLKDDCITMPKWEISGPNLDIENKEFYVNVTINKKEQVKVRCRIHHWSNDKTVKLPIIDDFYKKPSESIFPEDKAVLDEMPLPHLMSLEMKKISETQSSA